MADQLVRGDRLAALVAEKGRRDGKRIRQQAIADAANVQLRTVQIWLSSFTPDPETKEIRAGRGIEWENAVKLGEFFGVDPETLVTRPEEPIPSGATNEDVAGLQNSLDVRLDTLEGQFHRIEGLLNVIVDHFKLQAAVAAYEREHGIEAREAADRQRRPEAA